MTEKVFCIHRVLVEGFTDINKKLPYGYNDYNKNWLEHCFNNGVFLDRDLAEGNPQFKQIIPYVVLFDFYDPESIFSYSRSGSEKRLSDLYSIGVGGHINPCDFHNEFHRTIENTIVRELSEEIIDSNNSAINMNYYTFDKSEIAGIIYLENEDPVNQDHLGLLIMKDQHSSEIKMNEEGKDYKWRTKSELSKLNLETWSKIALEMI